MARTALNKEFLSSDVAIEQPPRINLDTERREPDIVEVDEKALGQKAYNDELAFNEEPVEIRIERSSDPNAPRRHLVENNNIPAEIWFDNRWIQVGWLPTGINMIVKRKTLASLAGAKVVSVETLILNEDSEQPINEVQRHVTASCTFTVIEDKNPRGHAWLTELIRRPVPMMR